MTEYTQDINLPAGLIIRVPSEDATHTSENTVPKACKPQSDMALGIRYMIVSIGRDIFVICKENIINK